jgi:peroxiredoxin (alkyl hydroperoxide reductase subunit C)
MLNPGTRIENFMAPAMVDGETSSISFSDYKGKWVVLLFYPFDFTPVCSSELVAFNERLAEFDKRGAVVIGASCDSIFSHIAWSKELGGIRFPVIGDLTKHVARHFEVLNEDKGCPHRAAFLIDSHGVIRAVLCNDTPIGRNTDEVLRLLDALQSGHACRANWRPGAG